MKRVYTSLLMLLAVVLCFPLSSSAEEITLSPTQTTVIQADGTTDQNADVVLYDASATSWLISQSKISGGAFSNMLSAYEGSPVLITKIDASSFLNGKMLKSATLKFNSVCTVSGKNSNVQIASIGTEWDATTATWNNTNTADILNAVGLNGDGVNVKTSTVTLTQDVTEILNADEDKVIGFAVFTYTGRQQKISDITLTLEAIDASASSNYTVKFVDESGNELKTADTRSETTGAAAAITNDDKASIYSADGTKKYIYVSDDATGQTISSDGSTTITVTFREAATWNYTINAVDGDGNLLQTLKSGTNFEAETFDVAYAAYINVDGTIWKSSKLSSDKKGFYFSMTLSEDNLNKNVTFTASDITNVVYFSEAEHIDGLTQTNNSNTFVRSSNGASAYAAGSDVVFTTLPNGKYTISTIICDASKNAGSVWKFNANNETVFEFTATAVNWSEGTSEEFTLNQASNEISLGQGGSSTVGVDLIYIQKTGDAEVAAPAAATGQIDFTAMDLPMSTTSSTDGDITEDKTFDVDGEFSVTLSPKTSGSNNTRFWNVNGKPELRVYAAPLTVKAAAGKTLTKIVFGQTQWGKMTASVGTLDGQTWTSEEGVEEVVFTVTSQCRITSITAGDYVAPVEPTTDVANIAAFNALEAGTRAKLALNDAKVTFVSGDNVYVEDATGALLLYKSGLTLTAGKALNGYIYGAYTEYKGLVELTAIDLTPSSEFTETDTELTATVVTVAQVSDAANVSKLVKLENVNIDSDLQTITQGEDEVAFYDKFGVMGDYTYPAFAKSIVGIVHTTSGYNTFHPVSPDSIVAGEVAQPVAENIAAAKTADLKDKEVKITLNNAKVTMMSGMSMDAIIEDETGAIVVDATIRNLLGAEGNAVNGTLIATVKRSYDLTYSLVASDNTANSELTSEPAEVSSTLTTIADIKSSTSSEIVYKYVKLENVNVRAEEYYGEKSYYLVDGNDEIFINDEYWTLPTDVEYSKFNSIQGIVKYGYYGYEFAPYGAYDGVEKEVVVAEAANIAEMKAMDDETIVKLALNNAKVSVVESSPRGGKVVYIEDETAGIQIDGDAQTLLENFTEVGQTINGFIYCQFSSFGDVYSINETSLSAKSEITVEAGTIEPKVVTVAEAKVNNFNEKLVKIENVQMAAITIGDEDYSFEAPVLKSGDDEVILSDMFGKLETDEDNNTILLENCNVTGVVMEMYGEMYFVPTVIEEVAGQAYKTFEQTTVMNMTAENVAAAVAEGWAEGGDTRTDNKKGYIDPETDEEISGAARPGIGLKKGNSAKSFKVYVTGLDALVAYGVSTNSTERNIVVTATAEDGTVVENQGASTGNSVMVRVDLDNAKKYVVEFAGTDADGAGADVALHDLKFIAPEKADENARTWDFTAWSAATLANMAADAATITPAEDGTYPAITPWRTYEKVAGPSEAEPDHGGNAYWYGTEISGAEELTANGVVIAETKGLLFNTMAAGALAVAVNYPSTSLGTYNGGAYLWIGGSKNSFTIPTVAGGSTIKMGIESHKNTDARGVTLTVNGTEVGRGVPTTYEEFSWTIGEEGDEAVDVVITNTNGCHIYYIKVESYDPNNAINEVNAVVNVINNDVYTINGVKVRNAGESLDGLAKGLYIIGGKKVVVK